MLETVVYTLLFFLGFGLFFGGLAFAGYMADEQEHRHTMELEKAKQGIFEPPANKEPFFKKYCKQIIFALVLVVIIIGICYIFKIPSDLPKYILEVIK